jgi:ribosomal subunit interface protein
MKTTITARHCEVSDDLKTRASTLLEKVSKLAQRPQTAEVIFNQDHQQRLVEMILHLPRGATRVALAEAADFQSAMDGAAAKLRHQLEKDKTTRKEGRRRKPVPAKPSRRKKKA